MEAAQKTNLSSETADNKTEKRLKNELENKKLHETAKLAGFKNLNELVEYSHTSRGTLTYWYLNIPDRFDAILKGSIMRKVEALKNG